MLQITKYIIKILRKIISKHQPVDNRASKTLKSLKKYNVKKTNYEMKEVTFMSRSSWKKIINIRHYLRRSILELLKIKLTISV